MKKELREGEVHLWMRSQETDCFIAGATSEGQSEFASANKAIRHSGTKAMVSPSRKFLREVLAHYECNGEITIDEKGKPRCEGIEFNLSHSVGLTVVAVSKNPVGVDVESATRKPRALEIARRYFSPAEAAKLDALKPHERTEYFLRLWVRKEAMTKLDGEGILLGASAAQVLDDTHGEYRERRVWLAEFGRDFGFVGAVAAWQPFEIMIND